MGGRRRVDRPTDWLVTTAASPTAVDDGAVKPMAPMVACPPSPVPMHLLTCCLLFASSHMYVCFVN